MRLLVTALSLSFASASAQFAAPPTTEPTGTVTGHVYLSGTGGPARLTSIALQPIEVKADDRPYEETKKDPQFRQFQTALDGSFTLTHIRPGTYYVVVKKPGYLSPFTQFSNAELVHPTPDVQQRIAAYLPTVTVSANNTAVMDMHLSRGASFSGTVRYDDGTPVIDTRVSVLQKDAKGKWKPIELASGGSTDDQGHYRITGLLAGDYRLRTDISINDTFVSSLIGSVNMMSSETHYSLDFYSGDTAHEKEAKTLHLENSQDMSSTDLTIPVSKLHQVSGAIVEARTGHPINSGKVSVYYDDGEKLATAQVEEDEPVFHLSFVPEGSYTLRVADAADISRQYVMRPQGTMPPYEIKEKVLQRYDKAEQPLLVQQDVNNLNIAVAPAK
jgi:hypothetical protein